MRKLFIAALVLAAGCDATRRDYSVCDTKYSTCLKGFTCNLELGLCVPEVDAGPTPSEAGPDEASPPVDVMPGEVAPSDAKDAPAIDVAPVDGPSVVDVTVTEVPPPLDVALPDSRVPDAPGSCLVDNDCTGSGVQYCVSARCVSCKTSSQCNNDAGAPFCSAQNTCVSCAAATGDAGVCSGTAPVCDPGSGRCVECLQNGDCPTSAKAFCVANTCQGCNVAGASAGGIDGGVSDGGSRDGGILGPCTGAKPVCATSGAMLGQCVQCVTSADCSGTTPVCNSANTCVPCTSDSQCTTGPGVCMFHQDPADGGGRCATDAETIYVQNSTGCTGGAGTAASPYCKPQDGINSVNASKRLVVMTGTTALAVWTASFGAGTKQVSVIGRGKPTISVGAADIGIRVVSGNVYIRGLTVQGSGASAVNAGIVVDSGATIGLDRCVVTNNAGGLLVNDGAGFDVANSVFAQNTSGSVGAAVFGGVYLGNAGTGLAHRFWFNTITNNDQFGAVCVSSSQQLDAMLFYSDSGGETVNCTVNYGSKAESLSPSGHAGANFVTLVGDPKLDSSYHLTASSPSPCKDWIVATSTNHPPDDIDGDLRPYPATGKLDCGADEYHP